MSEGRPEEDPRTRGEGIETTERVHQRRHGSDLLLAIRLHETVEWFLWQELKELLGLRGTGRGIHGKEGRRRFKFLSGELGVGTWLRLRLQFGVFFLKFSQLFMELCNCGRDDFGGTTDVVAGLECPAITLDAVELLLGDLEREDGAVPTDGLYFLEPWAVVAVSLRRVVSASSGSAAYSSDTCV